MSRMDLCALYANAKPEPVRPVKATKVVHRATGESAFKPAAKPAAAKPAAAKPAAKPAAKQWQRTTSSVSIEAYARALCGLLGDT